MSLNIKRNRKIIAGISEFPLEMSGMCKINLSNQSKQIVILIDVIYRLACKRLCQIDSLRNYSEVK